MIHSDWNYKPWQFISIFSTQWESELQTVTLWLLIEKQAAFFLQQECLPVKLMVAVHICLLWIWSNVVCAVEMCAILEHSGFVSGWISHLSSSVIPPHLVCRQPTLVKMNWGPGLLLSLCGVVWSKAWVTRPVTAWPSWPTLWILWCGNSWLVLLWEHGAVFSKQEEIKNQYLKLKPAVKLRVKGHGLCCMPLVLCIFHFSVQCCLKKKSSYLYVRKGERCLKCSLILR